MGGTLDARSRESFSLLFHALCQRTFPEDIQEKYDLPAHLVAPAKKSYIFVPPTAGTMFDYRYIKEVSKPPIAWGV